MILADFSRAFDTIGFRNLISKMSKLVFSRDFLMWTLNYVTHRKQFVQIDDTCSHSVLALRKASFWVQCYSIFVLLIRENLEVKCFQYADDTTIYDHAKVYDLNIYKNTIAQSINKLSAWSKESIPSP